MCIRDRYFFGYDKKKTKLYRSPQLEKVWSKGFSSVCEVEFDVAKYVAIYLQKPPADGRHRAFVNMSRNPGIGYQAIKPNLMETDKLYQDGKYIYLPRYYPVSYTHLNKRSATVGPPNAII